MPEQTPPSPDHSPSNPPTSDRERERIALFDAYAQAALTGLLSNPTLTTAAGQEAWLQGKSSAMNRLIDSGMAYAFTAMKQRDELLKKLDLSSPTIQFKPAQEGK